MHVGWRWRLRFRLAADRPAFSLGYLARNPGDLVRRVGHVLIAFGEWVALKWLGVVGSEIEVAHTIEARSRRWFNEQRIDYDFAVCLAFAGNLQLLINNVV